jgi:hypothetical protein
MRLKIDQQDGESLLREQLRSRHHRQSVRPNAMQQQHHRRLTAPIHPPSSDSMTRPGNRDDLRVESRRQRHSMALRFD